MSADGETGTGFTDEEGTPSVGAGSSDLDLLAVAGRKLVEGADLVVHTGSLTSSELLGEFCVGAERVNSVNEDLEELVPLIADACESGWTVVRLHSGDSAIYGAALEQMDTLARTDMPSYPIPDVTSAFAANMAFRIQLTLNEISSHVVFTRSRGRALSAEEDHISDFVGLGDTTICIYLGTRAVSETMDCLPDEDHDPDTPVAVVYHVSWPDEDVVEGIIETIGERIKDAGYRTSALVIIGETMNGSTRERSFLYDDWARGGDAPNGEPDIETQEPDNE